MVEYLGPDRDRVLYNIESPPIYTEPRGRRVEPPAVKGPRTHSNAPASVIAAPPGVEEPPQETIVTLFSTERMSDAEFLIGIEPPVREILLRMVPEELARMDVYLHSVLLRAGDILESGKMLPAHFDGLEPVDAAATKNIVEFVTLTNMKAQRMVLRPYQDLAQPRSAISHYIDNCRASHPETEGPSPDLSDPELTKAIVAFYQSRLQPSR